MPRFELVEGSASKFWEIAVAGRAVTTRWGRIGTEGQSKVTRLANPAVAEAAAAKQIREKVAKGYVATGARPARKPDAKAAVRPRVPASGIDALIKLVAPPRAPVEAPRESQWGRFEKQLGTTLPGDYKAMIGRYGTGKLDDFIWLANPFSTLMPWSPWFEKTLAALRESRAGAVFPEPAGFLPWASSENGNIFAFRTGVAPDAWQVIVFEARGPRFDQLPGGAPAALAALLSKQHRSPLLRDSFPPRKHAFTPFLDEHKTSIEVARDPRPFDDRLALLRKHVGKAKVEQSYAGEAIVRIPGSSIEITYRDCDQDDDGRDGAEIFACYATRDEAEVRRIVRETVAAARWKLGAIVDFITKAARWGGKP